VIEGTDLLLALYEVNRQLNLLCDVNVIFAKYEPVETLYCYALINI